MEEILGTILCISGLLFTYLAGTRAGVQPGEERSWRRRVRKVVLFIVMLPGLASGIPVIYFGLSVIRKREAVEDSSYRQEAPAFVSEPVKIKGTSATAIGAFLALLGVAMAIFWLYVLTS